MVTKLDRVARAAELEALGVALVVLDQAIDTSTPSGRLLFHVLGAIAEFERDLIRERTAAGLAAARRRGRHPGRPRAMNKALRARAMCANTCSRTKGAYAARRCAEATEFVDRGVSGAKNRRPVLDSLVAAVRRREVDAVVVTKLDRVARSVRHLTDLRSGRPRGAQPRFRGLIPALEAVGVLEVVRLATK